MNDLPRYLQLLWGIEPSGRRGPRPGRSIEEIGTAAIALADDNGLAAVSMKSVAEAVGFTTMSLYRYVDSKDELLAVMWDLGLGPPPAVEGFTGWRQRLGEWARAGAQRRLAHSWLVDVQQATPPLTPNALGWTETGLGTLSDTPLPSRDRFSVLLAVDGWAHNHVRQSLQMGLIGPAEPSSAHANYLAHIGQLVTRERFPLLIAAGAEAFTDDRADFYAEEFERGLGLLLDGVQAMIDRQ